MMPTNNFATGKRKRWPSLQVLVKTCSNMLQLEGQISACLCMFVWEQAAFHSACRTRMYQPRG